VLAGKKAELTLESGFHLKVADISVFFDIVTQSVLAADAGFMIEILSGGDIRRGLSLVREFLSSGHTTADRALSAYIHEDGYKFPPHEIFKGAVLGKRSVYREEESLLPNLYDSKIGIESLQLLRYQILSRLVMLASDAAFEAVAVSELIDQLYLIGIPSATVDACLKVLLHARAIRTSDGLPLSAQSKIIPNRLAGYLVRELGCGFTYFEMCLVDSYIFEKDYWATISDYTIQIESGLDAIASIKLRIERAREYLKYLSHIEERWVVECKRRNLGDSWGHQWVTTQVRQPLDESMHDVLMSAGRMEHRKERAAMSQPKR
jgi:hypothetical protein